MSASIAAIRPSHAIEEDTKSDVIRIVVRGFFDLSTLERHFAENELVVARWRAAGKPVRVLIDAVELQPHSPEGQACVQQATARIYRPQDRVAVRVGSSLVKMQMRRALAQGDVIEFFLSEAAALLWLSAS